MSIDRIGKAGGVAPAAAPGIGPAAGVGTGEAFRVARAGEVAAVGPLDRLRAGEIDMGRYLDLKVEAATAHLQGRLTPEQIDFVRTSLRDQIASDPALADLVRAATGASPPDDG